MTIDRLQQVLKRIDEANLEDPNRESWEGNDYAKEWLYSERMTRWLFRLSPYPTEAQQLAARGQHIRRWEVPRSQYPMDREGYLRWRSYLYSFHADHVVAIMDAVGYDSETMTSVKQMIGKQGIKRNPDVQLIEDVACLVFLEFYLAEFAAQQAPEKLHDIVVKTWRKMSDMARETALTIAFPEHLAIALKQAIGSIEEL